MMDNILKSATNEMVTSLNSYVTLNDIKYIKEIEERVAKLFAAKNAIFWVYDKSNHTLKTLDNSTELELEMSLTKQSIDKKQVLIENHVTSNKYYNAEIDNLLALKLKALIIYPILKNSRVIGVVKIWRGLKQRKVFTKNDEMTLSQLLPLFVKLIEKTEMDKKELLTFLGEETNVQKERIPLKRVAKTTANKKVADSSKVDKLEQELASLKRTFEERIHEYEATIAENGKRLSEKEKNKKELENAKKQEKETKSKLLKTQKSLKEMKEKHSILEMSSDELYMEVQTYQTELKTLKTETELLKKENKTLLDELKNKIVSTKSIKELKVEKVLSSVSNHDFLDGNIEMILQKVNNDFSDNEFSYMLFELMIYSLYSKRGIRYLEETIRKSKLVPGIIEGYYFKGDLQVNNEKTIVSDIVEHVKTYEKSIFDNIIKLNIKTDKDMPVSLVLDAVKIHSTLLHLLIDLYQFVDHSHPVDIKMSFKKKFLNIEIGGHIHQQNSLFKSMFKQAKLGGDEKDRIGLQLSKKLIERLKGKLNNQYEDGYYKFMMSVPTQVIKM